MESTAFWIRPLGYESNISINLDYLILCLFDLELQSSSSSIDITLSHHALGCEFLSIVVFKDTA
jgi:hypothetical protein